MVVIRAQTISYNGVCYQDVEVSDRFAEAYKILKKMEENKKVYNVRMNGNKTISLNTGEMITNHYVANPLQEELEKMGLVVERDDCYNWFYVKEHNDVYGYFK